MAGIRKLLRGLGGGLCDRRCDDRANGFSNQGSAGGRRSDDWAEWVLERTPCRRPALRTPPNPRPSAPIRRSPDCLSMRSMNTARSIRSCFEHLAWWCLVAAAVLIEGQVQTAPRLGPRPNGCNRTRGPKHHIYTSGCVDLKMLRAPRQGVCSSPRAYEISGCYLRDG
jgi:hypothetical protein